MSDLSTANFLKTRAVVAVQWAVFFQIITNVVFGILLGFESVSGSSIWPSLRILWLSASLVGGFAGLVWATYRSRFDDENIYRKRVESLFSFVIWVIVIALILPVSLSFLGTPSIPDYYITRTMSLLMIITYLGGIIFAYLVAYVLEIQLYHSAIGVLSSLGKRIS